ncbi:hypothetical protein ACRQ5Q_23175 [Bradyrhizobium sp. PMVTL-01]
MDDYRDLVTVGLALLWAGIMLVAGQLYLEHRSTNSEREIETPARPEPPPMVLHAPRQKVRRASQDLASERPS